MPIALALQDYSAINQCFTPLGINERLVYVRPDGVKYRLHAPPSRVVMTEEGFGTPPMEYIVDQAPFQHGDTVRNVLLQPRPVQLVVMQNFVSRPAYWDGRASLLDAIRPNRVTDFNNPGSLLYYLGNGDRRQLDVFLDSGPGFAPRAGGWREWMFTEVLRFTAHDPVWYDPTQQSTVFTVATDNLVFPTTFPITFETFGGTAAVAYLGTWLEYPSFTVTGPVSGLHVHNHTTDDHIALEYDLPAGYSLTIVLNGVKTITRSDGLNLLNYLSDDSDLTTWSLAPDPVAAGGINSVHIQGTGTSGATAATMNWYNRFFGI